MQFYVLNFLPVIAGYYRFYRVFSTVLAKYFFPRQKPNPVQHYLVLSRGYFCAEEQHVVTKFCYLVLGGLVIIAHRVDCMV